MEITEEMKEAIKEETANTEKSFKNFTVQLSGWILFLAFWVGVFWLFAPDKYRYSLQYSVPRSHVFVHDKPNDCEFLHSPIGLKGCTYRKLVLTDASEGHKATEVYVYWVKESN